MRYSIYVMLGLHTSFHHSWRGDTPDEAGFGTDIRIVRCLLDILDRACAAGSKARVYWDLDVYWTAQQILPANAPDIVDRIRARVTAGRDEIVLGYFNNGANHAATERELRTAIRYAGENPFGSGLRQLFGRTSRLLRPQESMYTAGQNAILLDEGITGLVLYYSSLPFNALSTFVPALPPEQRYNPIWLRARPDEPPIAAWPCLSPMDIIDNVSLEALLLRLHRLQVTGHVRSDLLLHLNFDADSDTWLPAPVPRAFRWFPNTGGLEEYIRVVDRFPWAHFTVPSEYAASHPPTGEVLICQDLADGGFDGNYSWAEKYTSLLNWTALERSRLHSYRAEALARYLPEPAAAEIRRRLWDGVDSPFFRRLVGLTTTHFGMSTPVINEERQARATDLLGAARDSAAVTECRAARAVRDRTPVRDKSLYTISLFSAPCDGGPPQGSSLRTVARLPLILPAGVCGVQVKDRAGRPVSASLVNPRPLPGGDLAAELLLAANLHDPEARLIRITPAAARPAIHGPLHRLQNRWLSLWLAHDSGIHSLCLGQGPEGYEIGDANFLEPFVTYRSGRHPRRWPAASYELNGLSGEVWDGLARARLSTRIDMDSPDGLATSQAQYTFTLFDALPYLIVDVSVEYADTPRRELIQTIQQKLRRLLDLRWIEVAPFQLTPCLAGTAGRPLRVWKHNYLGVTSHYDLDYGRINPQNRCLDSFNHQVTAGWVAVSDARHGLLLAESAEALASFAFCPMRLREQDGLQRLSLNPFGSYHGRQLDYRHLGGTGVGAELTTAVSASLRPNGPSFNGQRLSFSLLLAPYSGDEPPPELQAGAWEFFYPPGALYWQTPPGIDAVVPGDLWALIAAGERERSLRSEAPLAPPIAFVANAADGAADLAWEAPRDGRATGYEVRWRPSGAADEPWHTQAIPPGNRWRVPDLENRRSYNVQARAVSNGRCSDWTGEAEVVPGPVGTASLMSAVPAVSPWTLVRLVGHSLAGVLRARLSRS